MCLKFLLNSAVDELPLKLDKENKSNRWQMSDNRTK